MNIKPKTLLVGWDAADWKMIRPLMDGGLMPNLKGLIDNGVIANLSTLSPVLSPMLWTSIGTGKRPFNHGIHGFSEPTPDGSDVQPISSLSRTTKALWNILNQNDMRSHVVGWWPSHPAEPIDGVMVSNHYQAATTKPKAKDEVWPLLSNCIHPQRLEETLADLRLHPTELTAEHLLPFIPYGAEVDQTKDQRVANCAKIISECTSIQSAATFLMENEPWDFAAVYFDAIDHFGHGFMKYHPPQQAFVSDEDFKIYKNVVSAGYVYHDMMLGHLLKLAGKDATVMLVSDHGFHPDHLRPQQMPTEPAGPAVEHRDFGVFVMAGPGIKKDTFLNSASLLDVTPTLLTSMGLAVGEDMDGRSLDVFDPPREVTTIPSWDDVPGNDGQHPKDRTLDPIESKEAFDQLVALGYVEKPSGNREEAVARTQRELDYNLARSYMDAGLHGEAAPLLAELYRQYPLEFRFGIQLIQCFQALEMIDNMEELLDDLNARWRKTSAQARARLKDITEIGKQRREELRLLKKEMEKSEDSKEKPKLPDKLFSQEEQHIIRDLRAIAKGNERTLDYLASSVALARGDYEKAMAFLTEANESETRIPGFHIQVGNTWLKLKQYAQAETSFQQALTLEPENPQALVGLCQNHLAQRHNQKALDTATQAIDLKYFNPAAHYFLGIAQHRLKHTKLAIASIQQALVQNPNFAEAHSRLAMIYRRGKEAGDQQRSADHRWTATQIRLQQKKLKKSRKLPEIPKISESEINEELPELPKFDAAAARRQPWLGMSLSHQGLKPPAFSKDQAVVTIVSGLPRSGTSLMMQMLGAGGLRVFTDGERLADEHNQWGYFELEKIKQLSTENDWLGEAAGNVIKVVAPMLAFLPRNCAYRVIMMERKLDKVMNSQQTMLNKVGHKISSLPDEKFKLALSEQFEMAKQVCLSNQVPFIQVSFDEILSSPDSQLDKICEFLEKDLDKQGMISVVNPNPATV